MFEKFVSKQKVIGELYYFYITIIVIRLVKKCHNIIVSTYCTRCLWQLFESYIVIRFLLYYNLNIHIQKNV